MKPLAPNTLLQNRYLVVHLIGRGGMGEVYLAVDQRLGSAVALKRTFFNEDEMLGSAFEREARTLARLRHAVLPKVSDHFVENENQFLVMEHISGDDLGRRLEANGKPFPLNWVLFWADQLLDALHYLHSHEPPIIHRDIKPQNLKLTDENHIVLLDFGLSKNSVGQTHLSTSGAVSGFTPHYAPMEQIRGTGTNARSDIYSLSATLYQLLTNIVPPDALTRADSLLNGTNDPVAPIHEINQEVTKQISDIILKGMSVSQEQRFSTAREMQKSLRDAFAQMQSKMSAETVAFNVQDESAGEAVQNGQEVDLYATLVDMRPDMEIGGKPTATAGSSAPKGTTESASLPKASGRNNEPALSLNSKPQTPPPSSEPLQAGIKTEVLLVNDVLSETEEPEEKIKEAQDFSPEATIPLMDFDSHPVKTNAAEMKTSEDLTSFDDERHASPSVLPPDYFSEEKEISESEFDQTENFQNEPAFAQSEKVYAPAATALPHVSKPAPEAKKSGGKPFLILGGLFALFVLALAAGAGGWYAYNNLISAEIPKPTPEISPSIEVTPEMTPEPTLEANRETQNTNVDLAVGDNTNTVSNSLSQNTNSLTAPETPRQTTRTTPQQTTAPRTTPPPITSSKTPQQTKNPATTPVKKTPTPKKIEILQ